MSSQCTSQLFALQVTELPQALLPAQVTLHALPAQVMAPMQLCSSQRMSHEEAWLQSTPEPHEPALHCTRHGMSSGQRSWSHF